MFKRTPILCHKMHSIIWKIHCFSLIRENQNAGIFNTLQYFAAKLSYFTKFGALFPAMVINTPNFNFSLLGEWSITANNNHSNNNIDKCGSTLKGLSILVRRGADHFLRAIFQLFEESFHRPMACIQVSNIPRLTSKNFSFVFIFFAVSYCILPV